MLVAVSGGMSEFAGHPSDDPSGEPTVAGGVRVDRFEGLPAGEAIALVRRAGLRPALERVEGYAPDVEGLVVSQEPAAGSMLQADGPVRLFIAAPRRAIVEPRDEPDAPAGESLPEQDFSPSEDFSPAEDFVPEDWHVGGDGYEDETIEMHTIAVPRQAAGGQNRGVAAPVGAMQAPGPVEPPAPAPFEEQRTAAWRAPPASDGSGGRQASPYADRPSPRRWASWRSLPSPARWALLGVGAIVGLVLAGTLLSGARGSAPQTASAPHVSAPSLQALPRTRRQVSAARTVHQRPPVGVAHAMGPGVDGSGQRRRRPPSTPGQGRLSVTARAVRPAAPEPAPAAAGAVVAGVSPQRPVTANGGMAAGAGVASEAEHVAREFGLP